jgi:hypothetical protein
MDTREKEQEDSVVTFGTYQLNLKVSREITGN